MEELNGGSGKGANTVNSKMTKMGAGQIGGGNRSRDDRKCTQKRADTVNQ